MVRWDMLNEMSHLSGVVVMGKAGGHFFSMPTVRTDHNEKVEVHFVKCL